MKTIKQQRLDFLNETVAYYSADTSRRAMSANKDCYYYQADTGNKCAIGRHINFQDYKNNEIEHGVPVAYYIVFALLPESVRRLGKDFLSKVQILHDGDDYWYFNSLSDKGKQKVNSLIDSYCS